ncbi:beta-1,4-galactosyltransferase 7 isoform X2 [Oratosquilla oratoria]|uniref:beta-1,4-galactosyltransferase 7 isoform X2 n=1 Tax=Oratosquilla oratoria TaxID=337810 RepID=UPI003F76FE7B
MEQSDCHLRKFVHHEKKKSGQHYLKEPNLVVDVISFIMRIRRSSKIVLSFGLGIVFLFYIFIPTATTVTSKETDCNCRKDGDFSHNTAGHVANEDSGLYKSQNHPDDPHKLAILIPFRDRFEELLEFAPHISEFLNRQKKNHHIFVINQVDNLRFNRASLLNVGFLESSPTFDYVAMHDVDLLPLNKELVYEFPSEGPFHVAAPHLHPRVHFHKVDGLSNKYWGWGLEDDEFYARLKEAQLSITRPGNLTSSTKNTFRHIHDRRIRKRDMIKCYNQQEITRKRDRQTGLSTTRYHIQSKREITVEGAEVTILNVILECNRSITPWCDCTENVGNTLKGQKKREKMDDIIVPKIDRKKHITQDG